MKYKKMAVIADVHGNRWALEAVLEDIEKRAIADVFDLGDCLYGPLDPAGTAEILMTVGATTVRGLAAIVARVVAQAALTKSVSSSERQRWISGTT